MSPGNSLVVWWLGLCTSTSGGTGSIPDQGTKIPHTAHCGQKQTNKQAKSPEQICLLTNTTILFVFKYMRLNCMCNSTTRFLSLNFIFQIYTLQYSQLLFIHLDCSTVFHIITKQCLICPFFNYGYLDCFCLKFFFYYKL